MSNLHAAWGELVEKLTGLSAPQGFDVDEWATFVQQRQEILDSIAVLEAKGAVPHLSLVAEDTFEELQIQCREVVKGIEGLRARREEVGNQIRISNQSKIRIQQSILRETPFRGSVSVTA